MLTLFYCKTAKKFLNIDGIQGPGASSHYIIRILFLLRKIQNTIKTCLGQFLEIRDFIMSRNFFALCGQISSNSTPVRLLHSLKRRPTLQNIFPVKRPVVLHLNKKYPTFIIVPAAAYHVSLS